MISERTFVKKIWNICSTLDVEIRLAQLPGPWDADQEIPLKRGTADNTESAPSRRVDWQVKVTGDELKLEVGKEGSE
jgi:hypothetical protein